MTRRSCRVLRVDGTNPGSWITGHRDVRPTYGKGGCAERAVLVVKAEVLLTVDWLLPVLNLIPSVAEYGSRRTPEVPACAPSSAENGQVGRL